MLRLHKDKDKSQKNSAENTVYEVNYTIYTNPGI